MWPTKQQWNKWSLPSKLTAIGTLIGVVSLLFSVLVYFLDLTNGKTKNQIPTISSNDTEQDTLQTNDFKPILRGQFLKEIYWGYGPDVTLVTDIDADGIDDSLRVGLGHPNGFKIQYFNGNVGTNLAPLVGAKYGLDEFGDLLNGFYLHIAVKDVTNDGVPELLVAVGDGIINSTLNVLRYEGQTKDPTGRGNTSPKFKNIHIEEGATKINVKEKGFMEFPYGSQGLFSLIKWNGTEFVSVSTKID